MSQATTGAPAASIASIAVLRGARAERPRSRSRRSRRRSPRSRRGPRPSPASGTSVAAPLEPLEVRRRIRAELVERPDRQHVDLVAGAAEQPRRDHPVAAVVALAADDPDRPGRGRAARSPGPVPRPRSPSDRATGRRDPRSPSGRCRSSRRRRRAARASQARFTPASLRGGGARAREDDGRALSREWVSETASSTPRSAARSAARPCSRSTGAGPPTTSTSRGPQPPPSALIAASLAANRAARCRPGRARSAQALELAGPEQALGEPRPALQGTLDPIDLDQVDPERRDARDPRSRGDHRRRGRVARPRAGPGRRA